MAQGTEAISATQFTHTINTHNHMYGFQVGADALVLGRSSRFRIDGFAKTGIFYDAASQNSEFSDPNGLGDFSAAANGSHTSFLGELGLVASYQITKHAALRGGYQVMWIEGVALAPRQIPSTGLAASTAEVETSGGLFYHGANAGLEVTW